MAIRIPSPMALSITDFSLFKKGSSFLHTMISIVTSSSLFSFILATLPIKSSSSSSSTSTKTMSTTTISTIITTCTQELKPSSYLGSIPRGEPDDILETAEAFTKCTTPHKINICIGAYRDENGRPWVLPSVRKAESIMINDPHRNKEYSGVIGDPAYIAQAVKFAFGHDADQGGIAAVQTLSGTGACRLGAEFLAKFSPVKKILIPDPTWGNHIAIFDACGLDVMRYRYYNRATNGLDFDGMMKDIGDAPDNAIVLLHACAHNPTGCDPSKEQWRDISNLCRKKNLQVFFDCAYQGFASGDAEEDAFALRYFADQGHDMMIVAQSFSKNFGLYGERCGALSIVTGDQSDHKERVLSQLKSTIRPMYSSPPIHGSSIVKTILADTELSGQYYKECAAMAKRTISMRKILVDNLNQAGSVHDWSHIGKQTGMFAFTGMSSKMCEQLTDGYSIFLTRDGRISLAGLNESNVEYVAKAMHAVTHEKSITLSDKKR